MRRRAWPYMLVVSILENIVCSGQKNGGRKPGRRTQRAMVSAIISSSALLSLGVMEHRNDSGRLGAYQAISLIFSPVF